MNLVWEVGETDITIQLFLNNFMLHMWLIWGLKQKSKYRISEKKSIVHWARRFPFFPKFKQHQWSLRPFGSIGLEWWWECWCFAQPHCYSLSSSHLSDLFMGGIQYLYDYDCIFRAFRIMYCVEFHELWICFGCEGQINQFHDCFNAKCIVSWSKIVISAWKLYMHNRRLAISYAHDYTVRQLIRKQGEYQWIHRVYSNVVDLLVLDGQGYLSRSK